MKRKIQVMLVEDNPEYREVIHIAFLDQPDIELMCQFGTAEIAIRTLADPKQSSSPDLILLDMRLPGMDGLDALPQLREQAPKAKVIILTQSDHPQDVVRAITLGASGYLLKSATLDEIIDGVQTVMGGGASLDKSVAKYLLDAMQTNAAKAREQELLTQRELEIIGLLAEGFVKKEIAKHLGIGYSTVDTHVAHIYEKLDVSNAPAAIHQAHVQGLLPPESL